VVQVLFKVLFVDEALVVMAEVPVAVAKVLLPAAAAQAIVRAIKLMELVRIELTSGVNLVLISRSRMRRYQQPGHTK
jgi:hypothetical protein